MDRFHRPVVCFRRSGTDRGREYFEGPGLVQEYVREVEDRSSDEDPARADRLEMDRCAEPLVANCWVDCVGGPG